MSGRVTNRIFCSKATGAHMVGRVVATPAGLVVRYRSVVHGIGGPTPEGVEVEYLQQPDEGSIAAVAWCRTCRKELPISLSSVLSAALRGERITKLPAEGMWRDPIGVLDRKHRRGLL